MFILYLLFYVLPEEHWYAYSVADKKRKGRTIGNR